MYYIQWNTEDRFVPLCYKKITYTAQTHVKLRQIRTTEHSSIRYPSVNATSLSPFSTVAMVICQTSNSASKHLCARKHSRVCLRSRPHTSSPNYDDTVLLLISKPTKFHRFSSEAPTPWKSCRKTDGSRSSRSSISLDRVFISRRVRYEQM